ncbi:hypothetical protein J0X19_18890 [Hymenobacter sp. BT186]|uniref:Uncharacterized protein n=1 Tax=Hymenobacter telluris TaxID=2816474 RepID=A0A939EZH1_9BACT|nr:hypothetical protein [Hymenobacter telluris]MBO0360034.1 hypothetical protein [Hymenobacter telluris]MBW3376061.1 hypothetical protein [Hymenobacter norwichensis]
MAIFDNIAKAAKDFFVEEDDAATKPAVTPPAQLASASSSQPLPSFSAGAQPEQRHLDHIAGLLTGDGKDFAAYMKMVKSMAAAGMSGPLLYQTAFNAFAAINGATVLGLLASAATFETALQSDRNKVLERHREKIGETKGSNIAPSVLLNLTGQEQKLALEIADLTRQLQEKQQQLTETQQQLTEERQKTQSALASYEAANASALSELQTHRKAAETFLAGSGAVK